MASPAYLTLQNIIDATENNLNEYLKKAGYTESYDKDTADQLVEKYPGSACIESPVKNLKGANYIFVPASKFRNSLLTAERIANTLHMRNYARDLFKDTPNTLDDANLKNKLIALQAQLRTHLATNNAISKSYNKYHCSWKQSASMNLNLFSTWWNTSWRKSRATHVFENCLNLLKGYVPAEAQQFRAKNK